MPPSPLSLDTSPDIERRQVEIWRHMTPEEKTAIVTSLTQTVINLARAGIRDRYPEASAYERRLRLAVVLHGRELAMKAYPDIASLDAP
jgi:hypothetical protein